MGSNEGNIDKAESPKSLLYIMNIFLMLDPDEVLDGLRIRVYERSERVKDLSQISFKSIKL
jgi:hypothetical protein